MSALLVAPATRPLLGHVCVPGDKSIGHRALLFAALCSGSVRISGLSAGADNGRTGKAIAQLGVELAREGDELIVHGVGVDGLSVPTEAIDCGNSGTTMRLLAGLLAGQRFTTELVGDASLSSRPMGRVSEPLGQMGARFEGAKGQKTGELYPPLVVHGRELQGIDYALPMASAQVKSAIVLAALYARGVTRVSEPGPSRDHTERMLLHLGAPLQVRDGVLEIDPRNWQRQLRVERLAVPGDPSSAAFVIAAALLVGAERVTVADVCVNPTRTGFLDALAAMGARVEKQARNAGTGEPTADLTVSRGAGDALVATEVAGALTVRAIDELPILAVVAARARGVTRFRDAQELRVKESDRIATTAAMLRAFGVRVEEQPAGLLVHGQEGPLRAARVDAAGDHRIAMAAAVAALVADGESRIEDADNVATSFPSFAALLRSLGADIRDA